jgi:glycosyltransferase involved in cell wall biosynthesis
VNRVPLVSIGLPVFCGERYLREALDSVLGQTVEDLEVVVSDNASTDGTADILADYAARDPRVRVSRSPMNRGAGWNFNHVLHESRGTYFKWLAHDDLIDPRFLERCIDALEAQPDAVLAHTGVELIDATGAAIGRYPHRPDTSHADPIVRFERLCLDWHLCYQVFGVIRRDLLEQVGDMPSSTHGDGILLGRLALRGAFVEIDECLLYARIHPDQSMARYGHLEGVNDYRAYARWFDPRLANHVVMPNWTILRGYHGAVWSYPGLTVRERMRGEWVVLRRMRKEVRRLAADLVGGATEVYNLRRNRGDGGDPRERDRPRPDEPAQPRPDDRDLLLELEERHRRAVEQLRQEIAGGS